VIVNNTTTSFNGEGGVKAEPTPQEQAAEHEQHTPALAEQTQHETLAAQNKQNFASENHGRPAIAATSKPGDFSSKSAVPARAAGAEYHAPAMSPKEARGPATPAQEKGAANGGNRPFTPPNSGNKTANSMNEPRNEAKAPANPAKNNASKPAPHKASPPPKKSNPPKEERKEKGR